MTWHLIIYSTKHQFLSVWTLQSMYLYIIYSSNIFMFLIWRYHFSSTFIHVIVFQYISPYILRSDIRHRCNNHDVTTSVTYRLWTTCRIINYFAFHHLLHKTIMKYCPYCKVFYVCWEDWIGWINVGPIIVIRKSQQTFPVVYTKNGLMYSI